MVSALQFQRYSSSFELWRFAFATITSVATPAAAAAVSTPSNLPAISFSCTHHASLV